MAPRESLISCMSVSHIQVLYSTKPMSSGVYMLTFFAVFFFFVMFVFFSSMNIYTYQKSICYTYTRVLEVTFF